MEPGKKRGGAFGDVRAHDSEAVCQSAALITSEAFTTAMTVTPPLMPRLSTASFVIDEVTI